MSRKLLHILLLWCSTCGAANPVQTILYEASYLGFPLLDMTLSWVEDDTSVFITYDNQLKPFLASFHPIHNIYQIHFRKGSFAPISWSKMISEGQMQFELEATLSADDGMVLFSTGEKSDFPVGGFTIFSATHYLASKAQQEEFFPVKLVIFIDGELWEATAQRYDSNHPHPDNISVRDEILVQADLHYISGDSQVKSNDILTSVIATEGTRFLLWVATDGTYTKAQFGRFPKTVVLEKVRE